MRKYHFIILIALTYAAISWMVFEYRNPLCNGMAFYRNFKAVVTFAKLPEYQMEK